MLSINRFNGSVGWALRQAQFQARAQLDQALRPLNLSTALFAVLARLEGEDFLSSAEIARRCLVKRSTVTVLIASLEKAGLVERSMSQSHGRIIEVSLSKEGAALLAKAYEMVDKVEEAMLDSMSSQDRSTLTTLLKRCAANLAE